MTTETTNIKKLINKAYNGLNTNLTTGFDKVTSRQENDFKSLNNGIGSIASKQGNEFDKIKGSISANASLVKKSFDSLNSLINETKNENKLMLESIDSKVAGISTKLDSMDAKLDILVKNMKVHSIDYLDISKLADAYEEYYKQYKRDNGKEATIEEKMEFVITYLKNRSYVRSN